MTKCVHELSCHYLGSLVGCYQKNHNFNWPEFLYWVQLLLHMVDSYECKDNMVKDMFMWVKWVSGLN